MNRLHLTIAVVTYGAAVILANWLSSHYGLVSVGFGLVASAGTFAAGFALLARDFVHRYGGVWFALAAVLTACAVSYLVTPSGTGHKIAVASAVAFVSAELLDLLVFTPLRSHGFARAAVLSNVVAAPVDTIVFLHLSGFGVTVPAVEGQLVGKLLWATLIPIALYLLITRESAADPVTA